MVGVGRVTHPLEMFSRVRQKRKVHALIFLVLMTLCFIDNAAAELPQPHGTDLPSRSTRQEPKAVCPMAPPEVSTSELDSSHGFHIEFEGDLKQYVAGETYEVAIAGKPVGQTSALHNFTDFVLSVHPSSQVREDAGVFKLIDDQLSRFSEDCPNSVTSTSAVQKSRVSVRWVAPPSGSGCMIFRASVVGEGHHWYADDGQLSREICQDYQNRALFDLREHCCACDEADYEVAFESLWSRDTHPTAYPENETDVHFSSLTGASHSTFYSIWDYIGFASEGVKQLAETGLTTKLEAELKNKSDRIRTVIKAQGLVHPNLTRKTTAVFRVDRKNHLVSLLSRMNPSPDWIVGVSLSELCLANCSWRAEKVIDLYPVDAGTREGHTFYPDVIEQPERPQRIRSLTSEDSPFYDEGDALSKPVARLTISRKRLVEKLCPPDEDESLREVGDPIDDLRDECATGEWTAFKPCDANCMRVRTRAFHSRERARRANCQSTLVNVEICEDCGICGMTPWSSWGECSVTCGRGWRTRHRRFKNSQAKDICGRRLIEKTPCHVVVPDCAEYVTRPGCDVTGWSEWSSCTESCGEGIMTRTRSYLNELEASVHWCLVQLKKQKLCHGDDCYFDSIGGSMFPEGEDADLQGNSSSHQSEGPSRGDVVDCVLSKWSSWSQCSQTRATSRQERHRTIIVSPQNGGRPCPEKLHQMRRCREPLRYETSTVSGGSMLPDNDSQDEPSSQQSEQPRRP